MTRSPAATVSADRHRGSAAAARSTSSGAANDSRTATMIPGRSSSPRIALLSSSSAGLHMSSRRMLPSTTCCGPARSGVSSMRRRARATSPPTRPRRQRCASSSHRTAPGSGSVPSMARSSSPSAGIRRMLSGRTARNASKQARVLPVDELPITSSSMFSRRRSSSDRSRLSWGRTTYSVSAARPRAGSARWAATRTPSRNGSYPPIVGPPRPARDSLPARSNLTSRAGGPAMLPASCATVSHSARPVAR